MIRNLTANTRSKARVNQDFSNCEHMFGDWYRLKMSNPRLMVYFTKEDFHKSEKRMPTREFWFP